MVVKTITVTQNAYEALKGMKEERESFSETILRISNKRSLRELIGILSPEHADSMEKIIRERRRERALEHEARVKHIAKALGG